MSINTAVNCLELNYYVQYTAANITTYTHRCAGMFNEPDTHTLVRTHSDTLTNLEKAFLLTAV